MQQDFLTRVAQGLRSPKETGFLDRIQSAMTSTMDVSPETQLNDIPDFGMPQEDFRSQVDSLFSQGSTLDRVYSAIDLHPEITDKTFAKTLATQHYDSKKRNVVAGVDISSYATDPNHEKNVAKIYQSIPSNATTIQGIDQFIKKLAPKTPVRAADVLDASRMYNVDPKLIIAVMHQDSNLGTKGLGARTNNPGNVGNDDEGNIRRFKTVREGVLAVAKTLAKHKVKTS